MRVSLRSEFPTDHLPLLRWLMFTGVSAFGFVLAWYYGLFHMMLAGDKTLMEMTPYDLGKGRITYRFK